MRRVGLLGRVRLQPPPVVVERDLPVASDTRQEPVERIRQTRLQLLDRRGGTDREPGSRPERFADPLPPLCGEEERLEPAEVLRAVDGEVAGLDLVADLEEQRALPAAAVRHAVVADERLQRRRSEVERRLGRNAAASRRAVFAVGPQAASATPPRPARRRTSSCSQTARRTGSARRAARPSARTGPCGRPASSSPGRTGPRAAAPRARLTAAGPAARRRRRRDRAAPRRAVSVHQRTNGVGTLRERTRAGLSLTVAACCSGRRLGASKHQNPAPQDQRVLTPRSYGDYPMTQLRAIRRTVATHPPAKRKVAAE